MAKAARAKSEDMEDVGAEDNEDLSGFGNAIIITRCFPTVRAGYIEA
jgi:hypothetical protein